MTKKRTAFYRIYSRLWPIQRLWRWLGFRLGGKVAGGPFAGMRYRSHAVWGNPGNKLLGTYEQELFPVLMQLDRNPPPVVFDIGASEGYYAVGLAWRWREAKTQVYAWESDPRSQALINAGSTENQVQDRIEVYGECTEAVLYEAISKLRPGLIIMDIEGAEQDVCSARCLGASGEAGSVWIVECHHPDIVETLKARFEGRFQVEVIPNQPRTPADIRIRLPLFSAPLLNDRRRLVNEGRPFPTPWIVAFPRQG